MNDLSVHILREPDDCIDTLDVVDSSEVTFELYGTGVLVPLCEYYIEKEEEIKIKPDVKFHSTNGIYSEEWVDIRKSEDIPSMKNEDKLGVTYLIQVETNKERSFYTDEPDENVPAVPPEAIRYIVKHLTDNGCRVDLVFGEIDDPDEFKCYGLGQFEYAWGLYVTGRWNTDKDNVNPGSLPFERIDPAPLDSLESLLAEMVGA